MEGMSRERAFYEPRSQDDGYLILAFESIWELAEYSAVDID